MIFTTTQIAGVMEIALETIRDERGSFVRTYCREEFQAQGLCAAFAQCAVSTTSRRGTLRGMHFQAAPHAEAKLVRCGRGAIFDVAVDLRPASPTYCRWVAAELSAANGKMLYMPEGCAHGFLTLSDDVEVCYQLSSPYHAPAARGVRWDDPALAIAWPFPPALIAERDRQWPWLTDAGGR